MFRNTLNAIAPVSAATDRAGLTGVTPATPVGTSVTRYARGARQVEAEHVGDTIRIRDEEQRTIRTPVGIEMVQPLECRRRRNRVGRHVVQPDAIAAVSQAGEIRREAIRRERDRLAVGRPGRLQIGATYPW